jgi:hypothetical protein
VGRASVANPALFLCHVCSVQSWAVGRSVVFVQNAHLFRRNFLLSSATFFSILAPLPQLLGRFENPEILAARLDLPQLFFFRMSLPQL